MAAKDRPDYTQYGYMKAEYPGLNAVVYTKTTTDANGQRSRHLALGFSGKRSQPDFNFTFTNAERRDEYVADYLKNLEAAVTDKANRKAQRNQPSRLKVGDILSGSWGWEQTNREFYQVVGIVGPNTVKVREVCQQPVPGTEGFMSDMRVALPDRFPEGSEPVTKRVQYGDHIRFEHFTLTPWDGKPEYCSWYA